jgi:hypothetical protein
VDKNAFHGQGGHKGHEDIKLWNRKPWFESRSLGIKKLLYVAVLILIAPIFHQKIDHYPTTEKYRGGYLHGKIL